MPRLPWKSRKRWMQHLQEAIGVFEPSGIKQTRLQAIIFPEYGRHQIKRIIEATRVSGTVESVVGCA